MPDVLSEAPTPHTPPGNHYGLREWAGACGDLGTLLPFVLAYLTVLRLDPFGVLFGFGVSMIACGLLYKTPIPVQPMKAIGAVAVGTSAQAVALTPGVIQGACLVTALIWLLLGATGVARRIGGWVSTPVAQGVVLGLALALAWQGLQLMREAWLLAATGLATAWLLARATRLPGILALLLLGLAWTTWHKPDAWAALGTLGLQLRGPSLAPSLPTTQELLLGAVLLALPQAPLTLGNAIIGIRAENNRLFPERPVSERRLALSTGGINLFGAAVGAVPMCHGAGGMAAHVAFGARTGGAVVILGGVLLVLALGFSHGVMQLFSLVPPALLGAVLLITAAQLGLGQLRLGRDTRAWTVLALTAAVSVWQVAAGLALGVVLQWLLLRQRPGDSSVP